MGSLLSIRLSTFNLDITVFLFAAVWSWSSHSGRTSAAPRREQSVPVAVRWPQAACTYICGPHGCRAGVPVEETRGRWVVQIYYISFKKKKETPFNLLSLSDAIWRHRSGSTLALVICNGLLPDGTKPLPEPTLTYHQEGPVIFIWGQFHKRYLSHQSLKFAWKLFI